MTALAKLCGAWVFLACLAGLHAEPRGSTDYAVPAEVIDSGGAVTASEHYAGAGSIGVIAGPALSGAYEMGSGFHLQADDSAPEIAVAITDGLDLLDGAGSTFAGVTMGSQSELSFTVKNEGTGLLTRLAAVLDGDHKDDFTLLSTLPETLLPGASVAITVRFAPLDVGARTAALHLTSNDADENPFDLTLTAAAAPSPITIDAAQFVVFQGATQAAVSLSRPDATVAASARLTMMDGFEIKVPPFAAARGGVDYTAPAAPGLLVSFAQGQTTATANLVLLPQTGASVPNKWFTVVLGSPDARAALGARTTAAIKILANDATKPTLTLTAPKGKQVSTLSPLIVQGVAGDARGIDRVEVVLNGADPVTALLGFTTKPTAVPYSLPIVPLAGANTLTVTAYDLRGNSTAATLTFNFTRRYLLTAARTTPALNPDTAGAVTLTATPAAATTALSPKTANSNPQSSEILPGTTVKLTATAKTGFVFSHWSGLPGGATALGGTASFLMPSANATVTAVFIATPFAPPPGLANVFHGLIRPTGAAASSNATEGLLTGTLTNTGGFSGKLFIAGLAQPVTATFFGDGSAVFTAGAAKSALLTFGTRTLDLEFENGVITAQVANGADTSTGAATRPIYSASVKTPSSLLNSAAKGFYTVALPAPEAGPLEGHGFATLNLTNSGAITLSGTLADGVTFTAKSAVLTAGAAPFLAQLATPGASAVKGGSVSGLFTLDPTQTDSDVTGELRWFRAAAVGTSVKLYPAGWPGGLQIEAFGALYQGKTKLDATLGLGSAEPGGNAVLAFTGGNLTQPILKTNFNISGNTITKNPTTDKSFTLTAAPTAGTFSGAFTPNWPAPAATHPTFKGILLQKGAARGGYGFFISNAKNDPAPQSGAVSLGPPQ